MTEQFLAIDKDGFLEVRETIFPTSSPRLISVQSEKNHQKASSPLNQSDDENVEKKKLEATNKIQTCIEWVEKRNGVEGYYQSNQMSSQKVKVQTESVSPSLIRKRNKSTTLKMLPLRNSWNRFTFNEIIKLGSDQIEQIKEVKTSLGRTQSQQIDNIQFKEEDFWNCNLKNEILYGEPCENEDIFY